jgi:hypothetical protein
MFVVVTLICLWLGWETHYIRSRWAMIERVEATNGVVNRWFSWEGVLELIAKRGVVDWPIAQIHVHTDPANADKPIIPIEPVESLFPEAGPVGTVTDYGRPLPHRGHFDHGAGAFR